MNTPQPTTLAASSRLATAPGYGDPRRWWVLTACCLVGFAKLAEPRLWVIGLDIPASAFETAWRDYQILTNLGAVLFVACQLLGGVIGDLFGRRRVFLIGACGFTAGNLLSLLAPSLPALVGVRAVMGLMGALVFPLTLGLIRVTFAERERSNALLIYIVSTSLGTLASLAAIPIEELVGWRYALVLPIAAGMLGSIVAWRCLPESRAAGGFGRVEAVIASAWTLVFLLLIFGLTVAAIYGTWRNPATIAAGSTGVLGLLLVTLWPRSVIRRGLVLSVDASPRHLLSLLVLVSATLSFALSGYVLRLYKFFVTVQEYSLLVGGLALAPLLAAGVLLLPQVARLLFQYPRRTIVSVGLLAMAVAMGLTALARPTTPYLLLVPMMVLFGLGYLLAATAWSNLFLSALPADLVGVSSGISKAAGLTGGVLAGVVLGSVIQAVGLSDFGRRINRLELSPDQQSRALAALNDALQLNGPLVEGDPQTIVRLTLLSLYRDAYSAGIAAALLTAAALCLLTSAVVWLWLPPAEAAQQAADRAQAAPARDR